jgi:hypothetical protein
MPQETNLNVSPYFDDFDPAKNYYKVLFKPGYPVQARELTTLQSILQNQVEQFGTHVFKEGAKVIPGQTSYNSQYSAVELENSFTGIPLSSYIKSLVGTTIRGESSGVRARVEQALTSTESDRNNTTLYISYISSSSNNQSQGFDDGENLITESGLQTSNVIFIEDETFATTISQNATSTASSFSVQDGVYFLRGTFVNVSTQSIILDQYSNTPSYRIGFNVLEEVITSDTDDSLYDNSQGYNNFTAPGADRFKITAILAKKSLTDFDDQNFVEIATVQNGLLRNNPNDTNYNYLNDTLAARTYEESGDYYIKPFKLTCLDSLNDEQGNNGIFKENQLTYEGNTPSDDLSVYRVSPGKAYVRGYRVETTAPRFLDIEKPRSTKELKGQSINYFTGPSVSVNNVSGSPVLGINTSYTVSLRDSRIVDKKVASGSEIGIARVYDFALESGSYNTTNLAANEWDISLYDVQTYTNVILSQPVTLSSSTYVKGNSSGATGFVKNSVSNQKELKLYSTKGSFIVGESFSFDGVENGRVATAITSFGVGDVKSIYGFVSAGGTFNADTTQVNKINLGEATIGQVDGITETSIVTIPNLDYSQIIKKGGLVSYFDSNNFITEVSSTKGITTEASFTGQSIFPVYHNPTSTDVYVNGIKLANSEYVSLGSTAIQLNVPANNGDEIEINAFNRRLRDQQEFVAYDGQTVIPFTTTTSLTSTDYANTQIFVNGIKIDGSEFNIYTGTGLLHLNSIPEVGSFVDVKEYEIGKKVGLTTVTTTGADTTFNVSYVPDKIEVYVNGVKLLKTEYTASNGTSVVLSNATVAGDVLEVVQYDNSIVSAASTLTAVGLQTNFFANYNVGHVDVFYNGVKLRDSEFVGTSGTSIYVPTPATAGDRIEVISYTTSARVGVGTTVTSASQDDFNITNSSKSFEIFVDGVKFNKNDYQIYGSNSSFVFDYPLFANDVVDMIVYNGTYFTNTVVTATEGQTDIVFNYTVGFLDVYVNGIKLDKSNYTALDGTTISFNVPLSLNDIVELYNYSSTAFSIASSNVVYDKSYASIHSVGTNNGFTTLVIKPVNTVSGICNGNLPNSTIKVSDLEYIQTKVTQSTDNSLFTPLPRRNISDINLSSSNLTIRKQYDVIVTANSTNTIFAGTNETFLPFDEERYVLTYSDGTVQALRSDMFVFGAGSTRLTINGLSKNGSARLITTLRKINVVSKSKENRRSSSLIVSKSANSSSGIGTTTINDGLEYGDFPYGTRVQDEEISLNVPDVIKVYGVFESFGTTNPSSPKLSLTSLTGPNATTIDLILGETIKGTNSNAKATYVERTSDNVVEFVYSNKKTFVTGEKVIFEESGIEAIVSQVSVNGKDITNSFILDNGQRDTFYDYGRLRRVATKNSPTKKIKVYFQSAFYNANDDGDITTVNSYNAFNYSKDIQYYNELRNTDVIDIRPRVSSYTVTAGSNSPFEFSGRSFTQSGNSAKHILAPDESIVLDYSFYLPRIDKVFLNKNGLFKVLKGVPAENPNPPSTIDDSIEVAQIFLPPYLYNTQNASITQKSYKRYTMSDISRLEGRIKSLEKFTTLSLLETDTSNLFIPDKNGLNKFKSGFLVDNFKNNSNQDIRNGVKNSINPNSGELRPSHYTSAIDLVIGSSSVIGIGQTSDPYADLNFVTDLKGSNVKKTGDIISLNYTTTEWLSQTFATRTEKIAPYLVNFWEGTLDLTPDSDVWVDTVKVDPDNLEVAGNFTSSIDKIAKLENYDPQIGFVPTIWESWNIIWTGNNRMMGTKSQAEAKSTYTQFFNSDDNSSSNGDLRWIGLEKTSEGITVESIRSDTDKTSIQTLDTQEFDTVSVGDKAVASDITPFIRSRNVEFVSKRLKPYTKVFAFFDGVDVNEFIVPKLIEITMNAGQFTVGETISGFFPGVDYDSSPSGANPRITFRVATPNHKSGPYNAPTDTYGANPYNSNLTVSAQYSSTSTIVNVDTFSLANEPQGEYFGFIKKGMKLYGESSGAEATVQEVRLVTDSTGTVAGSFFIPDPNVDINPKFTSGEKVFKLTNSDLNSSSTQVISSVSEDKYLSVGTIQVIEDDVSSVKSAKKISKTLFKDSDVSSFTGKYVDPLAQTFTVDDETGIFLTGLDIYFESKDSELPVTCQIRTVDYNVPSNIVLPFTEITLDAKAVKTSADASVATHFAFKSPVYLEGSRDYAIVLLTNSNEYSVWTSRLGEVDVKSKTGASSAQVLVSTQPILGSLYKSQNASSWEPSIFDDLTFKLYRAEFATSGDISVYNPNLAEGNGQIPTLVSNSIRPSSRRVRIGISSALTDTNFKLGNSVIQLTTGASGNYVGSVGRISGVSITNSGIGYSPATSTTTYSNVILQNVTGTGKNAIADITVSNGVVAQVNIVSGGLGYAVGDVLTATIGTDGLGTNFQVSVTTVDQVNQIVLDNVQGNFVTGIANTIYRYNAAGITTVISNSSGLNLYISEPVDVVTDGLHLKVEHKNHGMHAETNYVTLSDILPDVSPTKLTVTYDKDYNGTIALDNVEGFENFENLPVSGSNPGYILANNEIIKYEGVSNGQLITVTRGIDNTVKKQLASGDLIYKYEFNGVSLRRINRTHRLEDASVANPIGLNYYTIKIDMSDIDYGVDRSADQIAFVPLYLNETKSGGGENIKATQNIPFEAVTPNVQTFVPNLTSLNASIRTVSGTSISGSETSFLDQGYEPIVLNRTNYLSTPRIIASKINEKNLLTTLPGNKSFTMLMNLATDNTRLSPIIDTTRMNLITTSNRINSVIENYKTDSRVNTFFDDPSDCQYVTKVVRLKNPASSLKLYLSAHINVYSDIRAFYAIDNSETNEPVFIPFPGYSNIDANGNIIDISNSDGTPDVFIEKNYVTQALSTSDSYSNYEFTANNLPDFKYFRIKIVMTSTNQAYVPKIKNMRAVALA